MRFLRGYGCGKNRPGKRSVFSKTPAILLGGIVVSRNADGNAKRIKMVAVRATASSV
jgi:hypothetical protein